MADLILPAQHKLATRFREPNLLVPGRKPVGQAALAAGEYWRAGMTVSLLLESDASFHNLATGDIYSSAHADGQLTVAGGNRALKFIGASNQYTTVAALGALAAPSGSVVVIDTMFRATGAGFLFNSCYAGVTAGADGKGISCYLRTSNPYIRLWASDGTTFTGTGTTSGISGLHDGNLHHIICVVDLANNAAYIYEKNSLIYSVDDAGSIGDATGTVTNLHIGANFNRGSPVSGVTGDIVWLRSWVKSSIPSAAERQQLFADPMLMYRPANQSPFMISIPGGGGLSLEPDGVSVQVGIGSPTLNPGSVSVAASGVSVAIGIGSPTVAVGSVAQDAEPAGVSIPVGIGSPTLATGAVNTTPDGVSVAVGVGSPTLVPGAIDISADGVSIGVGIGSPTVTALIEGVAQPTGVSVEIGVGSPTLVPGVVSVAVSGVSVEVGIGSPTITSFVDLLPGGISVPVGIGSPTLTQGAASLLPDGISVPIGIGSPSLSLQQQYAVASGVPVQIVIGSPSLDGGSIWFTIPRVSTIWMEI